MIKYSPNIVPNNVMIFGCGGTGGRLVPPLLQLLKSQSSWLINPMVTLFDGDEVEVKNLARQNFIAADVGRNKAQVLAERYSAAFQMDVNYYPFFLGDTGGTTTLDMLSFYSETFRKVCLDSHASDMYPRDVLSDIVRQIPNTDRNPLRQVHNGDIIAILCVDSMKARREILNQLEVMMGLGISPRVVVIDAGNEDIFGQVRIFNLEDRHCTVNRKAMGDIQRLPPRSSFTGTLNSLPYPKGLYDNAGDSVGTGSCADLDQTLSINYLMAGAILNFMNNITYSIPMGFHTIRVSMDGGYRTDPISNVWLDSIAQAENEEYEGYHARKWYVDNKTLLEDSLFNIVKHGKKELYEVLPSTEADRALNVLLDRSNRAITSLTDASININSMSILKDKGVSYHRSHLIFATYFLVQLDMVKKLIEDFRPLGGNAISRVISTCSGSIPGMVNFPTRDLQHELLVMKCFNNVQRCSWYGLRRSIVTPYGSESQHITLDFRFCSAIQNHYVKNDKAVFEKMNAA